MLELERIDCHYAKVHVLHGVSLAVNRGEIVSMIGAERGRQDHDATGHGRAQAALGGTGPLPG